VDSKFKLPAAREVQTWLTLTAVPAQGTTSSTKVQPINLEADHLNDSSESEHELSETLEQNRVVKYIFQLTMQPILQCTDAAKGCYQSGISTNMCILV
jgi:hypothetical protein